MIVKSVIDVVGKESFFDHKNNHYELACNNEHDCIGYSSKREKNANSDLQSTKQS